MVTGCLLPHWADAYALTGVYVLDTAARKVREPSHVLLEAIASAGNRLVAVGEHGVIIFSDDNGTSWTQADVPVDVTLNCVAFATPLLGWAAGHFGVILNTSDGGKTWRTQLNGIQANQLTLAAAQAVSAEKNQTSLGAPFAMRRANIFLRGGPNKPFLSLIVLSSQKLIVFGAFRMTMLTLNAGGAWTDLSLNVGDTLSHNLYAATVSGSDIYVVGEAGLVFRSTDGGNSFPAVTSPANATLFGVLAVANKVIITFGVAGNIFRSVDQGKTWQSIGLNTQDDLTAGCILLDGRILIGTEAAALFLSVDNGVSFQPISDGPQMSIFGIVEAADKNLVFVGNSGAIKRPMTIMTS